MNYLARMVIDSNTALSYSMVDSYSWHQRMWDCFPEEQDAKRDFLTRIDILETGLCLWLLALRKPTCPAWCLVENFEVKEISPSFLSHQTYHFDLRANPTKRLSKRDAAGNKLPVGKRMPLLKQDDLRLWLQRKAEAGGFRLVDSQPLEIGPAVENHFSKKELHGHHCGVQFRGTLEVTDRTKFQKTYMQGIGSAKGFGFGLLLMVPVK